ncbi:hypothetical protein M0R45_008786 [Rubus argutus]|uniref:Uncharacterized protein n=1 Tax=Rubus argutus TaxID=59490 RepID=A0AAW1Y5I8_RUBAR
MPSHRRRSHLYRCHELRVPSFTAVKPLSPARSNQITADAAKPSCNSSSAAISSAPMDFHLEPVLSTSAQH